MGYLGINITYLCKQKNVVLRKHSGKNGILNLFLNIVLLCGTLYFDK